MVKKKLLTVLLCAAGALQLQAQQSSQHVLTIDEMFRLADENSKSIRSSLFSVDEAEQAVKIAKNDRLPSIEASVSFSYIGNGWMSDRHFKHGRNIDMPHGGNNFSLKAMQTVYAGGAVQAGIELSKLQKQEAEIKLSDNRQNVRFLLLGYYLDLYQLYNHKKVYEKNIEQTRLLVDEIRASYAEGVALKSDITRYELQLQDLELGLTNTMNQINVLSRRLSTTIGLDEHTEIRPDTTILGGDMEKDGEWFWQGEKQNAPSMQLANVGIGMSQKQEKLARAGRRPTVGLMAANNLDGPILIEVPTINSNFNYWYVGINFSYRFDALFKDNKKVRQAKISTLRAKENRALTDEQLSNDIHAAYVQWEEAHTRLRTKEKSVQLAHENYDVIHNRYLNGLSLVTDMLDASNIQLSSELELNNARIDILYQYFLLKKTVGQL